MKSAVIWRARLARILGLALMLAGLAPVVWLAFNSLHSLHPVPIEPWAPLRRLPPVAYFALIALVVSSPGFFVMWLGATIAGRQKELLEAHRREKQDRLRRLAEYGSEERIEPYIGSPLTFQADKEPN